METKALRERLQDYIDAGIMGVYDLTPYSREQHDLDQTVKDITIIHVLNAKLLWEQNHD